MSSSSASASSRSVRSLTRCSRRHVERSGALSSLVQARLDRVAVDAAVLHLELIGELGDLAHGLARDEPEGDRLLSPRVLLARVDLRELLVRCVDRARVLEGLSLPLLPKDLVRLSLRPPRAPPARPRPRPRARASGMRAAQPTPGRARSRPREAPPSRARCRATSPFPRPFAKRDPES